MSGHSCALFSTSHLLTHLPPPFAYPGQRTYPAGFPVAPSTLRSLVRTGPGPRINGRGRHGGGKRAPVRRRAVLVAAVIISGRRRRFADRSDACIDGASDRAIKATGEPANAGVFNLFPCVYTRNHRRVSQSRAKPFPLFITAQRNAAGGRVHAGTRRCVSSCGGRFRGGKISATLRGRCAGERSPVNPRSVGRRATYIPAHLHPTGPILLTAALVGPIRPSAPRPRPRPLPRRDLHLAPCSRNISARFYCARE